MCYVPHLRKCAFILIKTSIRWLVFNSLLINLENNNTSIVSNVFIWNSSTKIFRFDKICQYKNLNRPEDNKTIWEIFVNLKNVKALKSNRFGKHQFLDLKNNCRLHVYSLIWKMLVDLKLTFDTVQNFKML